MRMLPNVFTLISVDMNSLITEDYQLYLNYKNVKLRMKPVLLLKWDLYEKLFTYILNDV